MDGMFPSVLAYIRSVPEYSEMLVDTIHIPQQAQRLQELAAMAESESWNHRNQPAADEQHPILLNYLRFTFRRLAEETNTGPTHKIIQSRDGESLTFNTGLVTPYQEPIYAVAARNQETRRQPWYLVAWRRRGEARMNEFDQLPEMAHYFDDPRVLVFDTRKELRVNVEHIIRDNRERFPAAVASLDEYMIRTLTQGAIENAKERIRRNYKAAIPQYYQGRVQLLIPLCLTQPNQADLALVVEDTGLFYRAGTCLTLDMAYNNARQLARPDGDWLNP